ncbi:MAG: type I methionyl aminopeptidase [Phycisphaeraceae bacterium]|nr:type I methionyl aminopeptidase [Phycisphaeraceae bacterium]
MVKALNMAIKLKTRAELDKMRSAGRVVHKVLTSLTEMARPGVTLRELDEAGYRIYSSMGARGLFKNYPTYKPGEGFPANLCLSLNDTVVHGIADGTVLREGDIIGIDCGVELDGWCGDSAVTLMIGRVTPEVRKLCEVTRHMLELAIQNIRPGVRWSRIARLMQSYAEQNGFSVVQDFVGHGIGRKMHEEPQVPNFVSAALLRNDFELKEGMVMAIEPMCNLGSHAVELLDDGWTVKTVDRRPAAHYEHTVAVTAQGALVLTDGN